uniref:Uncharacterized protein n=1 Tax=Caenorhabditis japonica TaxID=281687 RepID=A0A8R1EQ73_CAEJA
LCLTLMCRSSMLNSEPSSRSSEFVHHIQ